MPKNIKNITLNTLSADIGTLAGSIDDLTHMTARGFESVTKEIHILKSGVSELKTDVLDLKTDMSDVKLRLDYLAPKFEVRDLEKRVRKLEVKTGLRHSS